MISAKEKERLIALAAHRLNSPWFVQLYEERDGEYRFNGAHFDPDCLGYELPVAGDVIITPQRKADFKNPRDLSTHVAYEVQRRYIVPDRNDLSGNKTLILRLLVNERPLTTAEVAMWSDQHG